MVSSRRTPAPSYDLSTPRDRRREVCCYVEFDDYRPTISHRWHVRNAERALRKNTRAEDGVKRLTFGYPRWSRTSKEEVEREAGMTLDDTLDALPGGALPGNLLDYYGPEGHENGS